MEERRKIALNFLEKIGKNCKKLGKKHNHYRDEIPSGSPCSPSNVKSDFRCPAWHSSAPPKCSPAAVCSRERGDQLGSVSRDARNRAAILDTAAGCGAVTLVLIAVLDKKTTGNK